MIHFVHKGRNQHVIRHETVTQLNYRMAVSGRSDFFAYNNFPEVYHGQGISKAAFSGGERPVAGRGGTQHIASSSAGNTATSCVAGPLRAGAVPADPELAFFGSDREKREYNIGSTYPYAGHLHRCGIRIYLPSAYAMTIHMLCICIY